MEPLKIRVNGESSIARLAEQGVLRLTVTSEGPVLETVSQEVVSRSNKLSDLFKTLSPKTDDSTATADTAVTKFASTVLHTRSYTPRDQNNALLPKVYQALRIVFRDINKLSQAIRDAVNKANDYAREVGRELYPVEIMDAGTSAVAQYVEGAPVATTSLFRATNVRGGGAPFKFGSAAPNNPPEFSETLNLSPPDI